MTEFDPWRSARNACNHFHDQSCPCWFLSAVILSSPRRWKSRGESGRRWEMGTLAQPSTSVRLQWVTLQNICRHSAYLLTFCNIKLIIECWGHPSWGLLNCASFSLVRFGFWTCRCYPCQLFQPDTVIALSEMWTGVGLKLLFPDWFFFSLTIFLICTGNYSISFTIFRTKVKFIGKGERNVNMKGPFH